MPVQSTRGVRGFAVNRLVPPHGLPPDPPVGSHDYGPNGRADAVDPEVTPLVVDERQPGTGPDDDEEDRPEELRKDSSLVVFAQLTREAPQLDGDHPSRTG